MIKDLKSAYLHTLNVIESLKKEGIEVLIQTPRIIRETKNPIDLDIVKRYNQSDRLKYTEWKNVQFKIKNETETEKILFARRYLGINGIIFDTGVGCGSVDWEIDWSFLFTGVEEDLNREKLDMKSFLFPP